MHENLFFIHGKATQVLPISRNGQANTGKIAYFIAKSVAYFVKWAKFLPISRNRQFHRLGVTYIYTYILDYYF